MKHYASVVALVGVVGAAAAGASAQSATFTYGGILGTTFGSATRTSDFEDFEVSPPASSGLLSQSGGSGHTGGGLLDSAVEIGESEADLSAMLTPLIGGGVSLTVDGEGFANFVTTGYTGSIASSIALFTNQNQNGEGAAFELVAGGPVPYSIITSGDSLNVLLIPLSPGAGLNGQLINPGTYGVRAFVNVSASNTSPTDTFDGTWTINIPAPGLVPLVGMGLFGVVRRRR